MKTIVIYDRMGECQIQFFIAEGDFSKFDNIYVYGGEDEGLIEFLYDDDGKFRHTLLNHFPIESYAPGDAIIVCGFLP